MFVSVQNWLALQFTLAKVRHYSGVTSIKVFDCATSDAGELAAAFYAGTSILFADPVNKKCFALPDQAQ